MLFSLMVCESPVDMCVLSAAVCVQVTRAGKHAPSPVPFSVTSGATIGTFNHHIFSKSIRDILALII